jgi:nitrate reductase NapE component
MKCSNIVFLFNILLFLLSPLTYASDNSGATAFTQEDRERLIRLEVTMKEFKESVDKRFEQVDKRFEQVDKRFEEMLTFLWILTTIFVTLTLGNFGFAYWDRRTIIKKSTDEAISRIEKEGKLTDLIKALRELASKDQNLADILRKFHLL